MSEEECVDVIKQQIGIARSHLSNALECVSRPNKEYDKAYCELSKVNSAVTLANYAVLERSYWDENDVGYVDFKYCPMCGYRIIGKHVG